MPNEKTAEQLSLIVKEAAEASRAMKTAKSYVEAERAMKNLVRLQREEEALLGFQAWEKVNVEERLRRREAILGGAKVGARSPAVAPRHVVVGGPEPLERSQIGARTEPPEPQEGVSRILPENPLEAEGWMPWRFLRPSMEDVARQVEGVMAARERGLIAQGISPIRARIQSVEAGRQAMMQADIPEVLANEWAAKRVRELRRIPRATPSTHVAVRPPAAVERVALVLEGRPLAEGKLTQGQIENMHGVLSEMEEIARREEAPPGPWVEGMYPPGTNLVPVTFAGKTYQVSRFGIPSALWTLAIALGMSMLAAQRTR